jgi:predicted RNA-binding protein YlxR (DUF448 family)
VPPHRRCVGCGRVAPKSELLRVAVSQQANGATRAILDASARMPGRGAYLCRGAEPSRPAVECLALAGRRGAIARALRHPIAGDLIYEDDKGLESVSR